MPQHSLLYLDPHNAEHTPLIVNGLNMGNDWDSAELAADYIEQGVSNLCRWNAEVIVLQEANEPLAMTAWYATRGPELIGLASINYVYTAKQQRRLGYGALVIHAAEDRARERGFQHIWLSSVRSAVPFYEALTYRVPDGETLGKMLTRMTKDLTD
ncbi:MAG: hypothetical protein JWO47_306 [Candidatus Saccharibacteria bacterium]|nr:hypothetical protein [Candidatus Saccharibacteria bacterium]